jgi:PKD repeat protein
MRSKFGLAGVLLFTAALWLVSSREAQASGVVRTWAAAVDGNWSDSAKWSPVGIPGIGDDIIINLPGNYTVMIDFAGSQINTLSLGGPAGAQTLAFGFKSNLILDPVSGPAGAVTGNGRLDLAGGSLTVNTGIFTIDGKLDWSDGLITGSGVTQIGATGLVDITGANPKTLNTHNLVNDGKITWGVTSGNLTLISATIINNAQFDVNAAASVVGSGGVNAIVNSNTGTFRKLLPGTASIGSTVDFANLGVLEVDAGTLNLSALNNLINGTLTAGIYKLKGVLTVVFGFVTINLAEIILDGPGSAFTDDYAFDALSELEQNGPTGILRLKTGRNLVTSAYAPNFSNFGLVDIGAGCALEVPVMGIALARQPALAPRVATPLDYVQLGGSTLLLGGTLKTNGGKVAIASGTLAGTGSILSDLENAAQIDLGALPGTLSVTGNYTQQPTGVLKMRVGGTLAGSQHDQLQISGAAALAGQLDVAIINAFGPATGNTFLLLNYSVLSGTFTSVNGLSPVGGVSFETLYNATNVTVAARGKPVITSMTASKTSEITNEKVDFTATATQPGLAPLTYSWNFGDGSAPSTGSAVAHAYTTPGSFTVTLTVTDGQQPVTSTLAMTISARPNPVISGLSASKLSEFTNKPVGFAAVATPPGTAALTYTWDFGDGSAAQTGNPVVHTFTIEGAFTVTLTVTDGFTSASATLTMSIAAPSSGGSGTTNISNGKPPVENPLNGLTVKVVTSDGGVIEFEIDINALIRDAFDVNTDFTGASGRVGSQKGTHPVQKFTEPGIVIATITATESASGAERGKARKTVPISNKEVGAETPYSAPPATTEITLDAMSGKFEFNKSKPDIITFKGSIELPAGLDLSKEQTFSIGIANIIDTVTVDTKGIATGPGTSQQIKKLKIYYPRVDRATKLTTAGQKAKIVITLSTEDMDLKGADTEGITAALRSEEAGMTQVPRSIQVAMVLGGVAYEGSAPVQYKLAKDQGSGSMSGRRSSNP